MVRSKVTVGRGSSTECTDEKKPQPFDNAEVGSERRSSREGRALLDVDWAAVLGEKEAPSEPNPPYRPPSEGLRCSGRAALAAPMRPKKSVSTTVFLLSAPANGFAGSVGVLGPLPEPCARGMGEFEREDWLRGFRKEEAELVLSGAGVCEGSHSRPSTSAVS